MSPLLYKKSARQCRGRSEVCPVCVRLSTPARPLAAGAGHNKAPGGCRGCSSRLLYPAGGKRLTCFGRGLQETTWCRTRVSLPRHTPCSAHPCQCRRQVKHGSCAAYKKRILSAHEVRWRRFCLPLAGLFGVALRRVTVLSVCLRPACTEGSDPALLLPAGIKPDTALATAHQRQHVKAPSTTTGSRPGAMPWCYSGPLDKNMAPAAHGQMLFVKCGCPSPACRGVPFHPLAGKIGI